MSWCKSCHYIKGQDYKKRNRKRLNALDRARNKKNPDVKRNQKLKSLYGITLKDYNSMLKKQNDLCAICEYKSSKRLVVDHDHITGKVRSLLCQSCNKALGCIKENTKIAFSIINYLEFYK